MGQIMLYPLILDRTYKTHPKCYDTDKPRQREKLFISPLQPTGQGIYNNIDEHKSTTNQNNAQFLNKDYPRWMLDSSCDHLPD